MAKKLQCRFYSSRLPDVEDFVMVEVKKIAAIGAYVRLMEYGNKGAFYVNLYSHSVNLYFYLFHLLVDC